jgi:hypothetical protein
MPLQNFVDNSLPTIKAAWLNAIDAFYTTLFQSATTAAQARTALGSTATGDALFTAASAAAARSTLALGSAALLTAGTGASNAVQLDSSARLPAVDGSLITNMPAVGQCRLARASATSLILTPANGNLLTINGVRCTVPDAGVVYNISGLSSNTLYYVYATQSGGVVNALELTTTGHSTSTTAGNKGVEIKTGDNSRSLVGVVRTDGSTQFVDTTTKRFVRSWFNDPGIAAGVVLGVNTSMGSSPYVEINSAYRAEALTWLNERVLINGSAVGTDSSPVTFYFALGFDGAMATGGAGVNGLSSGGTYSTLCAQYTTQALSEGYHYFQMFGGISGGASPYYYNGHTGLFVTSNR